VFFGVTGTASWPNGWLMAAPSNSWGPVPLEAWAIAGVGYIALVGVARAIGPVRSQLGFPKHVRDDQIASEAVLDISSGGLPVTAGVAAPAMEPTG
ncbi:MAG: hypothetical protein QOF75_849, partial [Gaiellaceae bacterium]|nr:hypothetical protein [Gaiellaceae bacterium]